MFYLNLFRPTPSNSPYSYDLCKYFMNKQGYKIDLF